MEDALEFWKVVYFSNHWSHLTQSLNLSWNDQAKVCKIFEKKMICIGRRPQNMNSEISHYPLVGSYSNFKIKIGDKIKVQRFQMMIQRLKNKLNKTTYFRIIEVGYFSNHWFNLVQIVTLSAADQTKVYKRFKRRLPPIEDDLKVLKAYKSKSKFTSQKRWTPT